MTPVAAFRSRLLTATTSLVGARVREVLDPADAFPAVTYLQVSRVDDDTLGAADGEPYCRFQTDCWATTGPGAEAVADLVRSIRTTDAPLLPLVWGGTNGLTVQDIRSDDDGRSSYEPPRDASERGLFRVSLDLLVSFRT